LIKVQQKNGRHPNWHFKKNLMMKLVASLRKSIRDVKVPGISITGYCHPRSKGEGRNCITTAQ
jgi:hypothetical protein